MVRMDMDGCWMLDAVGYDVNGMLDYIKEYLDGFYGRDYDKKEEIRRIITKDYYDMWEED